MPSGEAAVWPEVVVLLSFQVACGCVRALGPRDTTYAPELARDLGSALVQRPAGVYQAEGEVALQPQQGAVVLLEDVVAMPALDHVSIRGPQLQQIACACVLHTRGVESLSGGRRGHGDSCACL